MRVSVATAFLAATAALATPHNAPSHDAVAKRLREREAMRELSIKFGRGEHDIDEVPDGLEYHGEPEYDEAIFADGPEDEDDYIPYTNGTSEVVSDDEVHQLMARGINRRLIAWTNEVPGGWNSIAKAGVAGLYTWTEWRPVECDKYKIPFHAMLKGDSKKDKFKKAVNRKGYSNNYLLAMNEVNIKSESFMDPGHAAWLINTYMVPVANKYNLTIVSPSFANGKTTIPWLKKFKQTQGALWKRIPIIALHYYGTAPEPVIQYIKDVHNAFPDKQIWITEIGCQSFTGKPQCNQSQANNFLKKVTDFVRSTSYVTRLAGYSTFVNSRVGVTKPNAMFANKQGSLTPFGKSLLSI